MDLSTVQVKNTSLTSVWMMRNLKPSSGNLGKVGVFDIRLLKTRVLFSSNVYHHSLLVKAMAKKNHDNPSGNADREGDNLKRNNSSDNKSNDTASQKSHHINLDWREFRANLFAQEQVEKTDSDPQNQCGTTHESRPLGLKWAHPITFPETGCVLVASERFDGHSTFERAVVLLIRSGTIHPEEALGVLISHPFHKRVKHMKPANIELATTFADCSLHLGGPVDDKVFLLKTGRSKLSGFEEVIPGLYFGVQSKLDEAAGLVKKGVLKPQDLKFYLGYAGWELDQLRDQIESDYWYAASCSSDLIFGALSVSSSENLWEEILQLMGGHYSELSQKPKQDL